MIPFRKRRKTKLANYAFIDSQNLNLGIQRAGWKLDWKKFREWLKSEYNVEKAFMFIGYMPDYEKLYDQLHSQGYLVVLKPTLEMLHVDENGNHSENDDSKTVKGNVDADLVLHVMKEFPNYSKAVIVSGDGDFYTTLEYLDQKGKLGCLLTPNWQYSSLLKQFDKYLVRLDSKRNELRYYDHKKSKKPSTRSHDSSRKSSNKNSSKNHRSDGGNHNKRNNHSNHDKKKRRG